MAKTTVDSPLLEPLWAPRTLRNAPANVVAMTVHVGGFGFGLILWSDDRQCVGACVGGVCVVGPALHGNVEAARFRGLPNEATSTPAIECMICYHLRWQHGADGAQDPSV